MVGNGGIEIRKEHRGHLFWGVVFTILAVMAFFRRMMEVAGIPVYSTCFFAAGISNFLRVPAIYRFLRIEGKNAERIERAAAMLNFLALGVLVISTAIALIRA